jgi:hypothetical protein
MRKLGLLVLVLALFACSSDPEPVSLDGGWSSKSDDPHTMTASILDGVMEIYFYDDGVHMLYWIGSVPETVEDGETFLSQGDVEEMEYAILASELEEKEFTYEDGTIVYRQGLLGVEWTVVMIREN